MAPGLSTFPKCILRPGPWEIGELHGASLVTVRCRFSDSSSRRNNRYAGEDACAPRHSRTDVLRKALNVLPPGLPACQTDQSDRPPEVERSQLTWGKRLRQEFSGSCLILRRAREQLSPVAAQPLDKALVPRPSGS